jgi:hypothetical protein
MCVCVLYGVLPGKNVLRSRGETKLPCETTTWYKVKSLFFQVRHLKRSTHDVTQSLMTSPGATEGNTLKFHVKTL